MSVTSKTRLINKLKASKEYRDAYVEEHIKTGLPFQLRAMRLARTMSQAALGEKAGMRQNAISRIEDEGYGSLSINTLLRLAAAFDVGLIVKFVPFSRLLKEYEDLSPESLNAMPFDADSGFTERSKPQDKAIMDTLLGIAVSQNDETHEVANLLQFSTPPAIPEEAQQAEYTQDDSPSMLHLMHRQASKTAQRSQRGVSQKTLATSTQTEAIGSYHPGALSAYIN